MKTKNYAFDLMVPNQINKDIIFNENIVKIDYLLNFTIIDIVDSINQEIKIGYKYIISKGEYSNYIFYRHNISREIEYIQPREGMIFFCIATKNFIYFLNDKWHNNILLENNNKTTETYKFNVLKGYYKASAKNSIIFLYLADNSTIDLTDLKIKKFTFFIKQNSKTLYDLNWSNNILWPNKKKHIITPILNSIDLVTLYKIAETNHYLGVVTNQNYQYI